MAVRAYLDVQLAGERGARLDLVAATADDVYLFVFRVNLGFHGICLWVAAVTERVQLSLTARGVASWCHNGTRHWLGRQVSSIVQQRRISALPTSGGTLRKMVLPGVSTSPPTYIATK